MRRHTKDRMVSALVAFAFAGVATSVSATPPVPNDGSGAVPGTSAQGPSKASAAQASPKSPPRDTAAKTSTSATRRPARRSTAASRRARALADARTPRFKLGPSGERIPDVRAEAAIVYNPVSGEVVYAEHEHDQRSIASITKVMTAVVFLDHELDLGRKVRVERTDVLRANHTYLRARDELTTEALLHLTLIGSDNAAARALARVSQFGTEWFIEEMNAKARELGLEHTSYADPSGLDAANVSSAYDMARLIAFASGHERISEIMRKGKASVPTTKRTINIRSTNKLIGQVDVVAGKTGFIRKAGYCLATLLRAPQGEQYAVVVLGARSDAGRFWETRHLFNWLVSRTGLSAVSASTGSHNQDQ